jgi:hypothetical protein
MRERRSAQVAPLDQLHGDVQLVVDAAGVEHLHQVGVVEPHRDLGLVEQPRRQPRRLAILGDLLDDAELLGAAQFTRRGDEQLPHAATRERA